MTKVTKGQPICNSRCHFKAFHLGFGMFVRCPDPTCDYPMIPTIGNDGK